MSRRPSLAELCVDVLAELDEEWRSPADFGRRLGLGHGIDHYRLALVLERLAADGFAELKAKPGSQVRKYRLAPRGEGSDRAEIRPAYPRPTEIPPRRTRR